MAVDNFINPPLRHISRATTSGTWVVPENVTRVFVTVTGARGGDAYQGPAGAASAASGFVEVSPGSVAQLIIGAGANSVGQSSGAGSGGTTSFDGAVTAFGSNGGSHNNRYGGSGGSAGTTSYRTSLPTGAPAGAIARVTSTANSGPTGDQAVSASGFIDIYA